MPKNPLMRDAATTQALAARLHQAEGSRTQIRQISLDHPEITIDDAYAIQRQWLDLKIAEGRSIKGHKIGLTSRAMQQASQIDDTDYGPLLDDMFFGEGDIPAEPFSMPPLEGELAFIRAKPMRGPSVPRTHGSTRNQQLVPGRE